MRDKEIREQFQQEIDVRMEQADKNMAELYKKNGETYRNEFRKVMETALNKFGEHQKSNPQKKLKYIYVNCLRVTLETENYEYVIRLMDEEEYADLKMVEEYYVPQYLKSLIDVDRQYFSRLIMSKVIRAKKYEVKSFLRKYLWNTYIKPIPREIYRVLSEFVECEMFINVNKAEEVIVGYGEMLEYLDECWRFTS